MSYFYFDNKRIYYKEEGEGTPLLLLHGNTASSNMFEGLVDEYKKQFKVILIDFLGHGKSDRLEEFPTDLWFSEAEQVIALLKEKKYSKVDIIGSSGGAIVAINVALEVPELVNKIIADSFEGEKPLESFTEGIRQDRQESKENPDSIQFYQYMHGSNWEQVVDNDTSAILKHQKEIGRFFHKELRTLQPDILLVGSKEDEFVQMVDSNYFEKVYSDMLQKIGHGKMYLFSTGSHPAMLSNPEDFYKLSIEFLK